MYLLHRSYTDKREHDNGLITMPVIASWAALAGMLKIILTTDKSIIPVHVQEVVMTYIHVHVLAHIRKYEGKSFTLYMYMVN